MSGGFHPHEVTIAIGRFTPRKVLATLRANGYAERGRILSRGADGSVDPTTAAGRLSLSALSRVAVDESRLVAASTTALAKAALSSAGAALEADVRVASAALAQVTAAVILPPSSSGRPRVCP